MTDTQLNTQGSYLDRAYDWGSKNPGKAVALVMVTTAALSVLAIVGASYLPPTLHAQASLPPMQPITPPFDCLPLILPLIPFAAGAICGITYYAVRKIEEKLDGDTVKRALVFLNPLQEPIEPIIIPTDSSNQTPVEQ